MRKKLAMWKGSSLSIAGRTTLINSSLSSSFIYHMSIYLLPKTIVESLDKQIRTFFQQGGGTKRKYHLVRWGVICLSKKKGGLGVKDIFKMNVSLLCKLWWRLENEEGLWQQLIKNKYLRNDIISTVKHRLDDSPIWASLLKIRQVYLRGRQVQTKNGKNTLFQEDCWINEKPICKEHPVLFDLCNDKLISVHKVLQNNDHLSFSRWLPPYCLRNGWHFWKKYSLTTLRIRKTLFYGNGVEKNLHHKICI